MANEKNLNPPWTKGESGNPKGRPKGSRNRKTIIKEILESDSLDGSGMQIVDQITHALVKRALEGNVSAFRELMDSAYGKVADKAEQSITYQRMGDIVVTDENGNESAIDFNVGEPISDS